MSENQKTQTYDIIILGGGLNGLMMAQRLRHLGVSIALISAQNPFSQSGANPDQRALAIAYGSWNFLCQWGVHMDELSHAPIKNICVTQENYHENLNYSLQDFPNCSMLGAIVDFNDLSQHLAQTLKTAENVKWVQYDSPSFYADDHMVHVQLPHHSDTSRIQGKLLIGADGRNSITRQKISNFTLKYQYQQTAYIFKVHHQHSHCNVAYEHFSSDGIIAALPQVHPYTSAIVWNGACDKIEKCKKLSKEQLGYALYARFAHLGKLQLTDAPRQSFSLSLQLPWQLGGQRCALIGDAAHVIHPLAGQGLNLGVRDVAE